MRTAVLFLVFNRPVPTRRVFETIRRARPPRLYVAADGPRAHRLLESARCDEVRRIATAVDWPCEVKTLFQDSNLGGQGGPVTGIDWFFENEDEGIILEDDCLPDQSFFQYCDELLHRFRDEPRVMMISGDYYHGKGYSPTASYFFGRNADIWGWATWARAWRRYDRELSRWPALRNTDWLLRVGDGHRDFEKYWTEIFDGIAGGSSPATWDYQWMFSCWLNDGLVTVPARNLVVNIGAGVDATRTTTGDGVVWTVPLQSMSFPMRHPEQIARDAVADRWEDVNVFGVKSTRPLYRTVLRWVPGLRGTVSRIRRFTA